ncbi:hypothetical protein [Tardiphaga sp.]|uniref:hypothetical protein n=1 Tax=Tardiphaga sp. TaxID=1926292 RepID=UPI002628FF21|nr:hypothetical protein [Tardiphaga sp.]
MEERDRLVAQTQAFVQQVAAAHPKETARPEIEQILVDKVAVTAAAIDAPAPPAQAGPAPAAPLTAVAQPVAPTAVSAAPARSLPPVVSERAEILERVAAFRARQAQMNEEREAYYETIKAKIRSDLGNEAGTGRL